MAEAFDPRVNYNRTTDSDVKYTGAPINGAATGDSLKHLLTQILLPLVSELTSAKARIAVLENQITSFTAGTVLSESDLYDLVDQSAAIGTELDNKLVTLDVKNSSTTNKLDYIYDLNPSLDALDSKYVPVGIETNIRTYDSANKLLASSSSRTGVLTIDKPAGPIIVTSRINIKSKDGGDLVLSKAFYLPTNEPANLTGKLQVSGLTTAEAKGYTQKDYNEVLASNVSRLIKEVSLLQKQTTVS